MKWYRYVHPAIFVASFVPLVLSLVPFWQGVAIPLLALIPYAANEILLFRGEKKDSERDPALVIRSTHK